MTSDTRTRFRFLHQALLLMILVPALWTLGRWPEPSMGVDAVSAVTPGHVSVVGARQLPAPLDAAAADSLVRRAFYYSGGVHKAFDSDARWILIRPGHDVPEVYREAHLQVLESALLAIQDAADEAELALLIGGLDQNDEVWQEALTTRLQTTRLAPLGLEILLVSEEETEAIDVPDSGMAADLYDLPVALLECDAVINIAFASDPLAAMQNLSGLARPTTPTTAAADVLVDQALLAEVSYTLSHAVTADGSQMLLASRDAVAVDRIAAEISGAATDSVALEALHTANSRYLGQVDLINIKVSGAEVPGTWIETEAEQTEQ